MSETAMRTGIVAIGRNEGERLIRCLTSLKPSGCPIVYVDSGSTDGSPAAAVQLGATAVALDMTRPFTAARARAEGVAALEAANPGLEGVFFIDGDCELEPSFLPEAIRFLADHPDFAVACGRRRERFPGASPYNRLMDVEWNTPVGETAACGGDALFRLAAYRQAGGYDPEMVAHEEPELCGRIRKDGWKLARLDAAMTVHDADIHSLRQYLRRAIRGGHGYLQALSRMDPALATNERGLVRRALQWPALFLIAGVAALAWPWALAVFLLLLLVSLARDGLRAPPGTSRVWFAVVRFLVKIAEFAGILRWVRDRVAGRQSGALQYKEP